MKPIPRWKGIGSKKCFFVPQYRGERGSGSGEEGRRVSVLLLAISSSLERSQFNPAFRFCMSDVGLSVLLIFSQFSPAFRDPEVCPLPNTSRSIPSITVGRWKMLAKQRRLCVTPLGVRPFAWNHLIASLERDPSSLSFVGVIFLTTLLFSYCLSMRFVEYSLCFRCVEVSRVARNS